MASCPYRLWEQHCTFDKDSMACWLRAGLFIVAVIIMIINVENVYGLWGLEIIHERSAVKNSAFGLWIIISERRYDRYTVCRKSFLAFQRCVGPSVLCKGLWSCKSNPSTFQYVSTLYSQGSYHFADFNGLITIQNVLCQGEKTIKLQILSNMPGSIKNVYYFIGTLSWYLPKHNVLDK